MSTYQFQSLSIHAGAEVSGSRREQDAQIDHIRSISAQIGTYADQC